MHPTQHSDRADEDGKRSLEPTRKPHINVGTLGIGMRDHDSTRIARSLAVGALLHTMHPRHMDFREAEIRTLALKAMPEEVRPVIAVDHYRRDTIEELTTALIREERLTMSPPVYEITSSNDVWDGGRHVYDALADDNAPVMPVGSALDHFARVVKARRKKNKLARKARKRNRR